jgi:hypothetical protein
MARAGVRKQDAGDPEGDEDPQERRDPGGVNI